MSDFRLKVFYSVAKNLSFTKASQELFVSQPAITKHIRELESLYQTRLFNRLGNTISLTESGNVLLEHCERIFGPNIVSWSTICICCIMNTTASFVWVPVRR